MNAPRYRKCPFFASVALTLAVLLTLPSCVWKTGTMIEDGGKTHWQVDGDRRVPLWMDDKGKFYAEADVIQCRYRHTAPWDASMFYGSTNTASESPEGEKPRHCWVELKPKFDNDFELYIYMKIAALLPEKPAHCVRVADIPEWHKATHVCVEPSQGVFKDSSAYWRVPLAWCSRVAVDVPLTVLSIGGEIVYITADLAFRLPAMKMRNLLEQQQRRETPPQPEPSAEKTRGAETKE